MTCHYVFDPFSHSDQNRRGKYTQKPRAMQTNLFDLHCRGATGYVAKPNISESWDRHMKDMNEGPDPS